MENNVNGKKNEMPVVRLFSIGFLLGILIPNLAWKLEWSQRTIATVYLLSTLVKDDLVGIEYFICVLQKRYTIYFLVVLSGLSVFGVPLAVITAVIFGMQTGLLLTVSVLQFGLNGGLVGAALLFPQYLIYCPGGLILLKRVYDQSMEFWKNRGIFPKQIIYYFIQVILVGILIFIGILLETYVNPSITKMLTKSLKFF